MQSEFLRSGGRDISLIYLSRSSWISNRALGRLSTLLDVMKVERSGLALLSRSEDGSGGTASVAGVSHQVNVS